jgi:hypothetical protein
MFTATPLNERGKYNGIRNSLGTKKSAWLTRPTEITSPVVAFIGASVPKQIASEVIKLATEAGKTTKFINLCVPARDINRWNNPDDIIWDQAFNTLDAADITPEEIKVVWTMQDDLMDGGRLDFPDAPTELKWKLVDLVTTIQEKFPNVEQVDLASRIYGYSNDTKHAEPAPFHTGWADKWAVEFLRNTIPFVTDKCYLWTDGWKERKDGIKNDPSYYVADRIHLSDIGEQYWGKVVYDYYNDNFKWFK